MSVTLIYIIAVSAVASAAPSSPIRYYAPTQLQQINPFNYYVGAPELENYYNQPEGKQANQNSGDETSSKLETLDPDSEVELIPGAQQPQQPPQQIPVAPNIPGLIPGQRVYIVHMPVPGIRPGTVGGYQPIYIVAVAPQENNAYPGYQNHVLTDPSRHVISPVVGYQRPGFQGSPSILLGASPLQRPFEFAYQDPAYRALQKEDTSVDLNQLISFQGAQAAKKPSESQRSSDSKSVHQVETEDYEPQTQASPNQKPKL